MILGSTPTHNQTNPEPLPERLPEVLPEAPSQTKRPKIQFVTSPIKFPLSFSRSLSKQGTLLSMIT